MDCSLKVETDFSKSPLADLTIEAPNFSVGQAPQTPDDGSVYTKEEIRELNRWCGVAAREAQEGLFGEGPSLQKVEIAQQAGLISEEKIKGLWRVNAIGLLEKAEIGYANGEYAKAVAYLLKIDTIVSQHEIAIDGNRMALICRNVHMACEEEHKRNQEEARKAEKEVNNPLSSIMRGRAVTPTETNYKKLAATIYEIWKR